MNKLLEQIAVTAELMGSTISPTAAAVMAKDLQEYPASIVYDALTRVRRESKGRFTLAAVIEQIEFLQPDGRPGAEEAWAMIPKDENSSAVMTDEMAEAYGIVANLINEGESVAARMAFKEAYIRIVEKNKRNKIAQKWFPSLGNDKEERVAVIAEAVRLGRLSTTHAIGILPPDKIAPMLQAAGKEKLALEHKMTTKEEALSKLHILKESIRLKSVI